MRSRYAYLHVPKAAGSSVMSALHQASAGRRICRATMDRTLFGAFDGFDDLSPAVRPMIHTGSPEDLAASDVVIGHFSLESLRADRDDDDIAVVLREPRARLLSLYTYWRGWSPELHARWSPYEASRRAVELAWPEFLDDASIAPQIDNVAARLLLGECELVPNDRFIARTDVAAVTDAALDRLRVLGHVDVVEHGAAAWARLGTWLGAELDVGRRNPTVDRSAMAADWSSWLTPASMASLRRRSNVDEVLWRVAAATHGTAADEVEVIRDAAFARQIARVAGPPADQAVTNGRRIRRWRPGRAVPDDPASP